MTERRIEQIHFVIEVPRWGFVKRGARGEVDFISPFPCPFNYGSIVGSEGADGDPDDVIVLGPRLPRGFVGALPLRGRIRFVDRGVLDDKMICADHPLDWGVVVVLRLFFWVYVWPKKIWNWGCGATRFEGLEIYDGEP